MKNGKSKNGGTDGGNGLEDTGEFDGYQDGDLTVRGDPLSQAAANAALRHRALVVQYENVSVACRGLGGPGRQTVAYDIARALRKSAKACNDSADEIEAYAAGIR